MGVAAREVPLAVLDTNAWLDVFWFGDPQAVACGRALRAGSLLALRSAATELELERVLAREAFRRIPSAPLLAEWRGLSRLHEPAHPAPWACRDRDDQKFLDLAVAAGASWLFTKDRALLKIAGRARMAGLCIAAPGALAMVETA